MARGPSQDLALATAAACTAMLPEASYAYPCRSTKHCIQHILLVDAFFVASFLMAELIDTDTHLQLMFFRLID